MENDQRWLWTLADALIPCSCRCWQKWNILDILKKRLTSVGCFQLSCAGVRLVLDVETLSAGSIDEEEKGPEPVGVCRVSDSNWVNQQKRVWVDDCSAFTPASWHFHRRRPPDMTAQSWPDHFFLNFSSEYFLVQAPTNQHPDREISRWSNLRSNYLGSVLYKKWRRRKAKGCVFMHFSLPASPNCLLRNIRGT